jgi:hypothetical protein
MKRRLLVAACGLFGASCASVGGGAKPVAVDLEPARAAVEEARRAGAPEKAPGSFNQALGHLREAEGLLTQPGSGARDRAVRAEWLARLSTVEAQCASNLSALPTAEEVKASGSERETLQGRLRRLNDEKRRLEDRVALLQRDLELTETEVIRVKARLQGMETKAEASSAVAEARILMRRLESRGKGAALGRVQELVTKAEQQLAQDNYGAAVFFARRAQDLASRAPEAR